MNVLNDTHLALNTQGLSKLLDTLNRGLSVLASRNPDGKALRCSYNPLKRKKRRALQTQWEKRLGRLRYRKRQARRRGDLKLVRDLNHLLGVERQGQLLRRDVPRLQSVK